MATTKPTNHSKPIHYIDATFNSDKKLVERKDATEDLTCCTFVFHHQDHTLGNALRSIISQYEGVELCGYTNPHPLEAKIHLRIQTDPRRDDLTPKIVLDRALEDLKGQCVIVKQKFLDAFDEFEKGMEYWDLICVCSRKIKLPDYLIFSSSKINFDDIMTNPKFFSQFQ